MDPSFTLGDLERQRQQTIAQLQQDGVWEMNRGVALPTVVQRVAVVSSAQAAGYQDFCKGAWQKESPYRFEVELFDAFMQGPEAARGVDHRALCRVADRLEEFDAVVIIRGGGSRSDLNCFNAYRLCSYIAQFPLPVITGIGHDKDTSVADLVAHTALKTPHGGRRMARRTDGPHLRMARCRRPAVARRRAAPGPHAAGAARRAGGRRAAPLTRLLRQRGLELGSRRRSSARPSGVSSGSRGSGSTRRANWSRAVRRGTSFAWDLPWCAAANGP